MPSKPAKDKATATKQSENDDGSSLDSTPSLNSPALSDLKEFMDPRKSFEDMVNKTSKKKSRKSSKIAVRSRYQSTSGRRPRQNVNAMHVNMSHNVRSNQDDSKDEQIPKNPFPMPDAYEEIYCKVFKILDFRLQRALALA